MLTSNSYLRVVSLLSFAVLTSAAGCKKDAPPSEGDSSDKSGASSDSKSKKSDKPAAKTPDGVTLEWSKPTGSVSKLTFTKLEAKGELSCFGGTGCAVRLEKLPEGTKVKLGAKEEVAKASALRVEFELGDALGKATPKDALSYDRTVDPGLSLEVTFPDGAKVSGALPGVTAKYMLEQDLEKKLANGTPVLFGKEPDAAPAAHTILFLGALMEDEKVMGPAKTMAEIDLVAVHTALPKKSGDKKCTGYKATNEQGPGREADLMLVDWDVSLIERKTAKVIEKKTFEAEKRCPMFAQGNETTSYPDRREIQTWLRSKR